METTQYTILLVDDEENILWILSDLFRRKGYRVLTAYDGRQAYEMVKDDPPDMVISDIVMPVMNGFELLARLEKEFPSVKRVLMTGYNIDEYMAMIRERNIGNILAKGTDFHLAEVSSYIESLLNGDIFGLTKYFKPDSLSHANITNYDQALSVCRAIVGSLPPEQQIYLEMAIDELISNAVYHAVLQVTGLPRSQWKSDYVIEDKDRIRVSWAADSEKIGVSVEDLRGILTKNDVLRWLDHPVDEPIGKSEDEHGRGLLLVRRLIDRFIINIDSNKRTECVIIQYMNRQKMPDKKPLLIHEL
jgi:CheY-like chemotaxis protein